MFRAYDPDRDRLVAVKLFRLDLPPERVHQLVAELERLIATAPPHPAIVAPIAAGIDGVSAYLAQEYVAAESLDIAVRQSGPIAPAAAVSLAAQLAAALDRAAVVGLEHGVLHPRDVLFSGEEAKLTGLGIARALECAGVPTPVRRPYTAPERLTGSAWDRRADVYGLAAIIREILWGRRVTTAGREAADSLPDLAGGDMNRLNALFGRALADDPARRFDTALEFAGGLAEAFPNAAQLPPALKRPRSVARTAAEAPPVAPVRRRPTTPDQRLPLELPADAAIATSARANASVADEGDLDLFKAEPTIVDLARKPVANEERMPRIVPDPVIRLDPPRAAGPSAALDSYQAAAATAPADERSRSAISPLAFALVVGAALGFAAGFGVGSRDRSAAAAAADPTLTADSHEFPADAAGAAGAPGASGAIVTPAPTIPPSSATGAPGAPGALGTKILADGVTGKSDSAAFNGSVLVRSAPVGASVLVDGRDFGRTPVTVRGLTRGAHRVEVVRSGYTAEARQIAITSSQPAHSMTVRLSPARAVPVAAPRPAPAAPAPAPPVKSASPLTVESRPPGAKVFLDGRLVGTTPLVLHDVAAGDHALALELDGYRRWTSSARVGGATDNRVTASLDR